MPYGKSKDELSAVHAYLSSVKDAWRNSTMHVENKYTEEEAEAIFNSVKGFIVFIASMFDEDGKP